jgi:uncharacterized protein YkvS
MTQLYIPPLKSKLRLLASWKIVIADCVNAYGNTNVRDAAWRINNPGVVWDYKAAERMTEFVLEEGTVIEFKRYHLSSQAKMDAIKLTIFASPRRDLMPKNRGGTSTQVEFEVPVKVLNGLQYEETEL